MHVPSLGLEPRCTAHRALPPLVTLPHPHPREHRGWGALSVIPWCDVPAALPHVPYCLNLILNGLFLNKMVSCALGVCKTPVPPLLPYYYFPNCSGPLIGFTGKFTRGVAKGVA